MTRKPDETEDAQPPRKPRTAGRDNAGWYPYFLRYQAGKTARQIAALAEVSEGHVHKRMDKLRLLGKAGLAAVRREALRRRRLMAEAEYLIGDPAEATRLSNASVALCRAEREERISEMETRNAAIPGENKEAKLSDAEVELLRADLRRRYIPELAPRATGPDAGNGDGRSNGRTGP